MSILDYNLDNVPDESILEAGEYQCKILSAKSKDSKAGKHMIEVALGYPDNEEAKTTFHYLSLPAEDDDQSKTNLKLRSLKNFYEAFDVDYSGPVDMDNLIGLTCFVIITEEESEQYGASNSVKRFLASK